MNFIRYIAIIAGVSSATCLAILCCRDHSPANVSTTRTEHGPGPDGTTGIPARLSEDEGGSSADFFHAADFAVSATVHIASVNNGANYSFGPGRPEKQSGSGALISQDGYIVTNFHVVENAAEMRVTLSGKRSFAAKLIGRDTENDLALIKIDARGLPFLLFGNSDELKPGQWVLATGYPLDLEATVTAGIISTKRTSADSSIPVNETDSPFPDQAGRIRIRSLIQTDAAINHGNSGGPLVNTAGQLIGIDSYFASPTGAYTGYSFAIPVNTVKKVIYRLMK